MKYRDAKGKVRPYTKKDLAYDLRNWMYYAMVPGFMDPVTAHPMENRHLPIRITPALSQERTQILISLVLINWITKGLNSMKTLYLLYGLR